MIRAILNKSWKQHFNKTTYHPSQTPSKLDEQDMRDTVGGAGTDSLAMFSYGALHTGAQV